MIIDTHSHVNFAAFSSDKDEVVGRTLASDIWMVNVGTKYETSKSAVELANQYPEGVYAAIGLHPIYAAAEFVKTKTDPEEGEFSIKEQAFNKEKYKELAQSKKVVAIGEIGLDYYYKPKTTVKLAQFKEKQKQVFIQQLDLAQELNLPIIVHCRMAHDDVIKILKERKARLPAGRQGVIHCFTGTLEQAQQYVELGFFIGLNGIIFKFNIDNVIKATSLEHIVVETDCPYLTPPQEHGARNEPIFIKHTVQRIAELKGVSFDEVVQKTTENARKLFNI